MNPAATKLFAESTAYVYITSQFQSRLIATCQSIIQVKIYISPFKKHAICMIIKDIKHRNAIQNYGKYNFMGIQVST
jgi:hypothetical protein